MHTDMLIIRVFVCLSLFYVLALLVMRWWKYGKISWAELTLYAMLGGTLGAAALLTVG